MGLCLARCLFPLFFFSYTRFQILDEDMERKSGSPPLVTPVPEQHLQPHYSSTSNGESSLSRFEAADMIRPWANALGETKGAHMAIAETTELVASRAPKG